MNDDLRREGDDPLHPTLREEELETLLQSWEIDRPSPDLGMRLLQTYRSKRSFPAGLLGGTIRVPMWVVATCLFLFLAMAPLAVRGLTSKRPEPEAPASRPVRLVGAGGATQLGSMETKDSMSMENYITVADLTELSPPKSVNLKVFRVEERNQ